MKINRDRDFEILIGGGDSSLASIPAVVTAAELTEILGVGERQLSFLAQRGVVEKTGPNQFAARRSIMGFIANNRRATSASLEAEKIRVARAQAEKLETQNQVARGELVSTRDVSAEWASILTDIRASLLAVPSRLSGLDNATIGRIDREIRSALESLADGKAKTTR